MNWTCSLARSIKHTFTLLLSLFLAPVRVRDPLMAAASLLAHMEAEEGKNRSRLGVVISPALTSFSGMSNGLFRKHYF